MRLVEKLNEDLKSIIKKDSEILITTKCFSIYAFQQLKNELKNIKILKFIFASLVFLNKQECKEKREFYIPRLNKERSIYETEFELKLKDEFF